MPEYTFNNSTVKSGLGLVKTVKPVAGDISFRFSETGMTLFSYDNRRYIRVEVSPSGSDKFDGSYRSSEFFVFVDKTAVFSSDLETLSVSVSEDALNLKAFGGGQTRKSALKKRSVKNKRPSIPEFPKVETIELKRDLFDSLLRSVSCSASIKDGKTEDDMRTMQVHFYPEGYAMSSTRFHASVSSFDGLNLDTSIISADIPAIRSFISKVKSEIVHFGQDNNKIYFMDIESKSFLALSKIASEKPKFDLKKDEYSINMVVDQELLLKNLQWASLVIERTQRISLIASKDSDDTTGSLTISCQKQEADGIPVTFIKGGSMNLDVPVDKLLHIIGFISDKVMIKYGHSSIPHMIEISSFSDDQTIRSSHYVASMRSNDA